MIKIETGNEFSDDFISIVSKTLKKHKHSLRLVLGSGLYIGNSKVDGYYCEDEKEIAIHVNNDVEWISTLAHEYNHFIQKITNSKKWLDLNDSTGEAYDKWWDWLEREIELDDKELNSIVTKIQDVEHECEVMTIETIKKYNLPVNLDEYILSSNSYIMFFQYAKKYRLWYSDTGSPRNEEVYLRLSKTKMVDSYSHLPLEWEPYFRKCV